MFHKSLSALLLYRFHKFNVQHSYRSCIHLCFYRKINISSYCCGKVREETMVSDIKRLQMLLQCTIEDADKAYQILKASLDDKNHFIECKNTVEWLHEKGATINDIRDNSHLLRRSFNSIKGSFELLNQMGWNTTDDFLPLLNLTKDEIIKSMANEPYRIRNQVYDFSQKCSMEPRTVSKYLAKNPFTFLIRRDLLDQKLEMILSRNINPEALLKDLDIFRYGADRIKLRIAFLTECDVEIKGTWMVTCAEKVIKRYLERRKSHHLKERYEFLAKGCRNDEEICPVKQIVESIECHFPEKDSIGTSRIRQSQSAIDQKIVKKMEKLFECSPSKAIELYITLRRPDLDDLKMIGRNLKWLKSKNVTMNVIIDNSKILSKPLDKLEENFILLKALNWRAIDDFIPLLTLTKTRIINRGDVFRMRIYDMANELSIKPHHVAKYCIKHSFIFSQKLDALKPKIEMLLEYDVMPENILRDLAVLETGDNIIKSRLEILSTNYVQHIMPWHVKCDEDKFERFIAFRKSKGPKWNYVHDTLMRKLMLHANTARSLMNKYEFLSKLHSDSLNSFLGLLLRNFPPQKIMENIHILEKSLAELNQRIKELQSLNADTSNEIFFVKTDDEFDSFIEIAKRKNEQLQ